GNDGDVLVALSDIAVHLNVSSLLLQRFDICVRYARSNQITDCKAVKPLSISTVEIVKRVKTGRSEWRRQGARSEDASSACATCAISANPTLPPRSVSPRATSISSSPIAAR